MLHYVIYIKGGFVLSREANEHVIERRGLIRYLVLKEDGKLVAECKKRDVVCISQTPAERVREDATSQS